LNTLLRFARRYLTPYLHWYLAGTLALAVTNWIAVSVPMFLAEGIDALELGEAGRPIILRSAVWVAGLGTVVIAVRSASRLLFFTPGRLVEAEVRRDLFTAILRQQPAFLDQWPTGDLVSRASSDTVMVRLMAGFATLGVVNTAVALAMTGTQMWRISPRLAAMSAVPLCLAFIVTALAANRLRVLMRRLQEQAADLSDHILSSYQGIATIHAFGAEHAFEGHFATRSNAWLHTVLERANLRVAIGPVLSLAATINVFILLYVGGPMAIRGEISIGELVAFTALVAYLVGPLRGLSFIVTLMRQAQAAQERLDAILDPTPDRPDLPDSAPAPAEPPAIEIRGLSFAYPDEPEHTVLSDIRLSVPAGGTLGIIGTTGSGKTTLLRCLARLYNPPPGTVLINGVDVRAIDLDRWRNTMQLVQQRAFLFTESVRDNILLGHPRPERLDEVLQLAAMAPDLHALPDGVDTLVGKEGLTLSGGQRQRVALARGLVNSKTVLMLDDVLSAVDHATEQQLIASLHAAGTSPTTVIVSNRCSALQHADVIAVLDSGTLIDQGTHVELIGRQGLYHDVWQRQRKGQDEVSA
jgi:ATP-binding cassette subfamily B protein